MLFLKKVCVAFLIVSFTTSPLNAHPVLDHFKEDLIQNLNFYDGTPVRVSIPSQPKTPIYISQQRARKFLGINEYGEPVSPPELLEVETLLLSSATSPDASASDAVEPPNTKIKKAFVTKLLSKIEAQEEVQQAVVREFLRCFASPPFEVFFMDFSELIFCSKSIKVSLDGNPLAPTWVQENQQYLKIGQQYRVRLSSPRLRSVLAIDHESEIAVLPDPQEKKENPFPWLRLFLGDRDLQAGTPPLKDITFLALMTPLLNPTLTLYPDFEEEREDSNIFTELHQMGQNYINFVLNPEIINDFHETYPKKPIWHLFLSPRAFEPGQQAGYDYINFAMNQKTIKHFLQKNPKRSLLHLFVSPLTFEAQMRFSLLKGMTQRLSQVQNILKRLFPESSPSTRGARARSTQSSPSTRGAARSTQAFPSAHLTVSQFLDQIKAEGGEIIIASQWESASQVYGRLLQDFFDVSDAESLQEADILNEHFQRYDTLLEERNMPFDPEDPKKAPEELRLSSEMKEWIYKLLKNPKISFKSALRWAFYFGFNVNYKPNLQDPSLLMELTKRNNHKALRLLLDCGAFCSEENGKSPLDEAIQRRYKGVFCEFLRKTLGRSPRATVLLHPEEALNWYHDLEFQGELDEDYETAFNTLSEQHAYFGWERLSDQFLIRDRFIVAWKANEEQKLRNVVKKLSPSLEEWRRCLEGRDVNTLFLRRFDFDYFVELFSLDSDVKLKESIEKEIEKMRGCSRGNIDILQEICPGISTKEEFYAIEMMRHFLERNLMRTIPFLYGKTLTQMHKTLKEWSIIYILSLFDQEFQPENAVVVSGYFERYRLPPYFLNWLKDPNNPPEKGVTFKTRHSEPVTIYSCEETLTKEKAAHLFLRRLFRNSSFECVKVEIEQGRYKAFSFFHGHETLETSPLKFDNSSGLLTAQIGNYDYPVSRRSLSEYLISLLILMPSSHRNQDALVFLKEGELNFSFGGEPQGFFCINPLDSRANFLPSVEGIHGGVLTSNAFESIFVDEEVSTFFKQLRVEDILVNWILEVTKIQSHMGDEGASIFPLSHQELSAFYLRLKCLQFALTHVSNPLTHWNLCRCMNPWRAYDLSNDNLSDFSKRKKISRRSVRWAEGSEDNVNLAPGKKQSAPSAEDVRVENEGAAAADSVRNEENSSPLHREERNENSGEGVRTENEGAAAADLVSKEEDSPPLPREERNENSAEGVRTENEGASEAEAPIRNKGTSILDQNWEEIPGEEEETAPPQLAEPNSSPAEGVREGGEGAAAEDSRTNAENIPLKLTLPPLSDFEESEKFTVLFQTFKAWMEDEKIGQWFGDMFACFPERDRSGEGTLLHHIKSSCVSPIFIVIPEREALQRKDLENLSLRGISFLTMKNQGFSPEDDNPYAVSHSIKTLVSFVSNSVALFYLDLSGLGGAQLAINSLTFSFSNLHTLLLNHLFLSKLSIRAPILSVLSLEGCTHLHELELITPCLKNLNLKRAIAFSDKELSRIMRNLRELESLNLEGTNVTFSEFRTLIPGISQEAFEDLTKRLSSRCLDDFLEGRGTLSQDTLCGAQDTLSQVGRVFGKTLTGPVRDIRTMALWMKRKWHHWRSNSPGNITSKGLHVGDVLKAPIAAPTATTAAAGAYWGYLPAVASHPFALAATSVAWWLGGSIKSVGREIEEEKRSSEALLGKVLALAIQKTKKTSVNLRGVGLGLEGLISFFMTGGMDNLKELNLENNNLGDIGGEFLKGIFAEEECKSLNIKLGGNNIRWSLLSEIRSLTAPGLSHQPLPEGEVPESQDSRRDAGAAQGEAMHENLAHDTASLSSAAVLSVVPTEEGRSEVDTPERQREPGEAAAATAHSQINLSPAPSSSRKLFGLHINGVVGPFQMRALLSFLEHLETLLDRRLGDFFQVIGGSNGGGAIALALTQQLPSSGLLFKSGRSSISVAQLRTVLEETSSHLMPTYNVSGQDSFFSWEGIESVWGRHFKAQLIEADCTATVTLEREGSSVVLTQEAATGLEAKSIATMLTRFPSPYHVGAVLAHRDQIYESETITLSSPSLVARKIEDCFPDEKDKNIYIISVEGSLYAQDLRNLERNGGRVMKHNSIGEDPFHFAVKFSLPLLPLARFNEATFSSLEQEIVTWFRDKDLASFTQRT